MASLLSSRPLASAPPPLAHVSTRYVRIHISGEAPIYASARHTMSAQASSLQAARPAPRPRATTVAAAAAPGPQPASPWYEDYMASQAGQAAAEFAPPRPTDDTARQAAGDPNHGYTWLTHPCPSNPFRSRVDEDAWYVPPSPEQRQLAQELGLPLYGIL